MCCCVVAFLLCFLFLLLGEVSVWCSFLLRVLPSQFGLLLVFWLLFHCFISLSLFCFWCDFAGICSCSLISLIVLSAVCSCSVVVSIIFSAPCSSSVIFLAFPSVFLFRWPCAIDQDLHFGVCEIAVFSLFSIISHVYSIHSTFRAYFFSAVRLWVSF